MSDVIAIELKSDLEHVCKITGELLNEIQMAGREGNGSGQELMERLRAGLMEAEAVLQKDIFNCDYILTRRKLEEAAR